MENQQTKTYIQTSLGKIAVYQKRIDSEKTPIIFLHGVYLDHHLWDEVIDSIEDRTTISLDMPWHGASRKISKNDWDLNDCAEMLLEIIDFLTLQKVIAIGHSWGSMTILRAANKNPDRFASIGLCNMPFLKASINQKTIFGLQHAMLVFRDFYTKQAGKALFGKLSLKENPALLMELRRSMNILNNKQIKQTDRAVIVNADDATELISNLKVKALSLKGEEDYVPVPPGIDTTIVKGGHISPLESPEEVIQFTNKLLT